MIIKKHTIQRISTIILNNIGLRKESMDLSKRKQLRTLSELEAQTFTSFCAKV